MIFLSVVSFSPALPGSKPYLSVLHFRIAEAGKLILEPAENDLPEHPLLLGAYSSGLGPGEDCTSVQVHTESTWVCPKARLPKNVTINTACALLRCLNTIATSGCAPPSIKSKSIMLDKKCTFLAANSECCQ